MTLNAYDGRTAPSNIPKHVSGEKNQIAQNQDHKTGVEWRNGDLEPVNEAGENSQQQR
jgi:hypothetical protein